LDDTRSFLFSWPVAVAIILVLAAGFGTAGYFIAVRRFRQPFIGFLVRYVVSFLSLILLEMALLYLVPSFHSAMRNLTATLVGGILGWVGVSHSVSGSVITLQNPFLTFDVEVACLGGVLFWVYIALVVAEFKATRKQRLVGIFVGLAILLGFNFFRITLSIYLEWRTGVYVHDYFYLFNMVFVLLVWAGWLRTLRRRRAAPAPAGTLPSSPLPH
jgi:exosortase/archaeosortase family protein